MILQLFGLTVDFACLQLPNLMGLGFDLVTIGTLDVCLQSKCLIPDEFIPIESHLGCRNDKTACQVWLDILIKEKTSAI